MDLPPASAVPNASSAGCDGDRLASAQDPAARKEKRTRATPPWQQGEIVCRAVGYTPWPVDSGTAGDRVRVDVGPINERKARSYVFERLLPKSSELVVVTLPQRPLGVMLTWDERRNRVVVEQLAEGSDAGRREKKSKLDRRFRQEAVLPDDLVRGVTCTNLVYPEGALWGAKLPERHIVSGARPGGGGYRERRMGSLCLRSCPLTNELTEELTNELTEELTNELTEELTNELTEELHSSRRPALASSNLPAWPSLSLVLYGVEDRLMWSGVRGAMQRGTAKDGPVTFVLERRTEEATAQEPHLNSRLQ
ncbi:MAG: hypothetical protein WDW36_008033 [Sanguina aurantia]